MKEINEYFKLLLLGFGIITLVGLCVSKKEQIKEPSRFKQAYQKVQYFDSLSQVYTDQNNLYMMIEYRDSMMYYFGEMIKNLKEE